MGRKTGEFERERKPTPWGHWGEVFERSRTQSLQVKITILRYRPLSVLLCDLVQFTQFSLSHILPL